MKRQSLSDLIRTVFESKEERTLHELYKIVAANPNFTFTEGQMKHRVRSAIYNLQTTKFLVRIDDSKYRKL